MPTATQPQPRVVTADEFPPFDRQLKLRCTLCGKAANYTVGRVWVDPIKLRAVVQQQKPRFEEMVSFSGYFHCKHCGAGGPWEFPAPTVFQLQMLVMLKLASPSAVPGMQLLRVQMFDGTWMPTSTAGEAHLKSLIAANSSDFFLWSRLGNLYEQAEQPELACSAFERAVELNPQDVESHYSLGRYAQAKQDVHKAGAHFHAVLRHCRAAIPAHARPDLIENIVHDALERLWHLHRESKGAIDFLPVFKPGPDAAERKDPATLVLTQLDMGDEKTWDTLVTMFLTGRLPEVPRRPASGQQWPPRPHRRADVAGQRVGRNQPCPCASGKKFKHCCGRGQ